MSTFAEMVDDVILHLLGMTTIQEQATHLTSAIGSSDLTVSVADTQALSRGMVEVDEELIWLDSLNSTLLTGTVPPYGRGFRSTTAATHASGARVVSAPVLPRAVVKRAINETILGLYPSLWGVQTTTFTYVSGTDTYQLPTGTVGVLDVKWQDFDVATVWHNISRYSVDLTANTTTFANGASIRLGDLVVPGRTVQVVVKKIPSQLAANSDVFNTVTGLPVSCEDVVRLGAAQRLVSMLDASHLNGNSAEADFSGPMQRGGTTAQALSRSLLQNYQLRLMQEMDRLNQTYPVKVRWNR